MDSAESTTERAHACAVDIVQGYDEFDVKLPTS
jgi:hypothetical protein